MRLLKEDQNNPSEAKKAQWEVDFFYFGIKGGELNPSRSMANKEGHVLNFPDLKKFDEKTVEYLQERLHGTKNILLKSRYSTILWNSPKKHGKYAKIAVDSFIDLIKIYENKDKKDDKKDYDIDIVETAKNAYKIALQSKYKLNESKSEIKRLINQFKICNSLWRLSLVELMLNDRKNFKKNDFNGINDVLWKLSKSLIKSEKIDAAIRVLEIGVRVENIISEGKYDWLKEIAVSYEMRMKIAENNHDSAAMFFCENALEYYKKIKDEDKVSELEIKYHSFKKSQKFKKFETQVDLTETYKIIKQIVKNLMKKDSDETIKYLMLDPHILPKQEEIEKFVETLQEQYLSKNLPTKIIDRSGNVSQRFSEPEEIRYATILKQYEIELELNTVNLLNKLFLTAIMENKLSYKILLNYLIDNSWYGKTIQKSINDKTIEYNWLDIIAPALFEYFDQIEFYLLNPSNAPNLVLVIDSLNLKMEGLFRDIIQNCGEITFYQTQDNKGRNISREKDINALLREDCLKKLFTKDEILFFKFLLVEKAGYNLRHNVAHAFLLYDEYSIGIAHLLLLLLLRLGKFDFKEERAL